MTDLDKKLRYILGDFANSRQIDYETHVSSEHSYATCLDDVKQALTNAGWRHDGLSEAVELIYKKRSEGIETTWCHIAGIEFMTGQQWLDNFRQHSPTWAKGDKTAAQFERAYLEAAKKASGVES